MRKLKIFRNSSTGELQRDMDEWMSMNPKISIHKVKTQVHKDYLVVFLTYQEIVSL